MIDLHTHTRYSDGKYSLKKLLKKAQKDGLNTLSITDHDNTLAYYELEKRRIRNLFSGKIINGIEITTSFNNKRIELLAYNFSDYKKVNEYFFEFYKNVDWEKIMYEERTKFLKKFDDLDIKYDEYYKTNLFIQRYEMFFYKSVLNLNDKNDLKNKLKNDYCEFSEDIFRKCIVNPDSALFINFVKYHPCISEVVNFIHSLGGIIFLAHPFRYKFDDLDDFLKNLYSENNIDGIEVYYDSFKKSEVTYLENFASKKNLLVSGGTDFHGKKEGPKKLGMYLKGNKLIPDENFGWLE